MGGDLEVDGARPAVAWVSRLDRRWTTPAERLLLWVIADDTWDQEPPFKSRASLAELADWMGVFKDTVTRARDVLEAPVPGVRPALLDVAKGKGRTRTEYRLRTEEGPNLWPGRSNHKEPVDNAVSVRADPTTNGRSGRASVRASVRADPTTPFPLPPMADVGASAQDRATCEHKRFTVDGDCLDCGGQIFAGGTP